MRRFFLMVWLCVFTCNVFAQALPVSSMQNAVSGVIQAKMKAQGFAANDPRWGATLQGASSTIAGAAAAAAVVTLVGVTAPAWVTAGIAVGLGTLFAYGINLAIDGTVNWLKNSDGTVTTGGSALVVDGPIVAGGSYWTCGGGGAQVFASGHRAACATSLADSNALYPQYAPSTLGDLYPNNPTPTNALYYIVNSGNPKAGNIGAIYVATGAPASCAAGNVYSQRRASCVTPTPASPVVTPAASIAAAAAAVTATDAAKPLNPAIVAALANSAMRQAAAVPGYAGLPVDVSNPITTADAAAWQAANPSSWPTVGNALSPQPAPSGGTAASPFQLPNSLTPVTTIDPATNTTPSTNPATGAQVNLGPDPGIGSPTLEATPSAQSILDPLLNAIPGVRSFVVPAHSSTCPTWSFGMWDHQFSMDGQCQLAEQLRTPISGTMLLFFALAALLIVLAA